MGKRRNQCRQVEWRWLTQRVAYGKQVNRIHSKEVAELATSLSFGRLEDFYEYLIRATEVSPDEYNQYGQSYIISGILQGPNGKLLSVRTIWMTECETGQTKFVTMYPDKEVTR